jgi:hypothetical protein
MRCEHAFHVRVLRNDDVSEEFESANVHTIAWRIAHIKTRTDVVHIVAVCNACGERDEWQRTSEGWMLVSDGSFHWERYRHLITMGLLTWAIVIAAIVRCGIGSR